MAGSVTKDDLKMAVTQYAQKNELTVSENENGFALMPGDIIVTLKDGKPECGNKAACWASICQQIGPTSLSIREKRWSWLSISGQGCPRELPSFQRGLG